jgi:hypothetical protein
MAESSTTRTLGPTTAADCDPSHRNSGRSGNKGVCRSVYGRETVSSNAATVSMAKVAKELGVPPAIIGRMVVTPPNEMVWLSPQELQSMGVTMVGKPAQTASDSPRPGLEVADE